jgi:hypothetical protein
MRVFKSRLTDACVRLFLCILCILATVGSVSAQKEDSVGSVSTQKEDSVGSVSAQAGSVSAQAGSVSAQAGSVSAQAGSVSAQAGSVSAQKEDSWSFVLTPQAWVSHIALNGFAASPNSSLEGHFIIREGNNILQQPFPSTSSPNETLDPQWGIQIAAQKGRWTFAAGFQYVTFETRNDLTYVSPNGLPLCVPAIGAASRTCGSNAAIQNSGAPWAQEFINTTRMDIDLSASYFFPDLVKDRLDASAGGGFKFIYASASRQFANLSPAAAALSSLNGSVFGQPGLYTICTKDDCSDIGARDRVKEISQIYGATIPMNLTTHLTRDSKWLLPFSLTPLIGAEHRNDRNIVYSATLPPTLPAFPIQVNREDGWKFAYGVTGDLSVRYIINDMFSAYAGFRVQYIHGFDKYLAYGPLFGVSTRFGGQ